jgi:Mrp family chromosome partitioning ATPase
MSTRKRSVGGKKAAGHDSEAKSPGKPAKGDEKAAQENRIADALSRIKRKYLVMSGKGGVGKTTVSVNLALLLGKRGHSVGLMDVDLHGPNTLKMLGMEGTPFRLVGERIVPLDFHGRLKVVSIAGMLSDPDSAVIWRGPLKIGVIRQFLSDVQWGDLDYLIIDSPPGTGDEPLTVAQTVKNAEAVIVTTPQEVSLMDVRKSITFCRQVSMPIAGIVENMSGLTCPHCGRRIEPFKSGGGGKTAALWDVPLLAEIPMDPEIMRSGDAGIPYVLDVPAGPAAEAFAALVENLLE